MKLDNLYQSTKDTKLKLSKNDLGFTKRIKLLIKLDELL